MMPSTIRAGSRSVSAKLIFRWGCEAKKTFGRFTQPSLNRSLLTVPPRRPQVSLIRAGSNHADRRAAVGPSGGVGRPAPSEPAPSETRAERGAGACGERFAG